MFKNLKIEHRIARDSLGESDDEYADLYVDALTAALQAEYPGAVIEVNLGNESQTIVNGDDGRDSIFTVEETVHEIAQRVWDRMD